MGQISVEIYAATGSDLSGNKHYVLGHIADHKITRLDELLPWSYAAKAA